MVTINYHWRIIVKNKGIIMKTITIITICLFISGCAGNHTPRNQAFTKIEVGTILEMEDTTIGGTNTGIAASVAGTWAIFNSGSDSFGGLLIRGLAAGLAGAVAEEALTQKEGRIYKIRTNTGTMLQIASPNLNVGVNDCVEVSYNDNSMPLVTLTNESNCYWASAPKSE